MSGTGQTRITIFAKPDPTSNSCCFQLSRKVSGGSVHLVRGSSHLDQAGALARELFSIDGVHEVFFKGNEVTISKAGDQDWKVLGKEIGAAIRRAFDEADQNGEPAVSGELDSVANLTSSSAKGSGDALMLQKLLDEEINPSVAAHGGYVELVEVKDSVASIRFSGGCQGCAASSETLRNGVEASIRGRIPGIREVRDVTDHSQGENPYYR